MARFCNELLLLYGNQVPHVQTEMKWALLKDMCIPKIARYSAGSQCEKEERCMGRRCVHWTLRSQCQEQLRSMKQRGILPKEERRVQFLLCLFTSLFLVYSGKRTLPFPISDLNELVRKLTLTTEEKYFLQDGLSSSLSPSSYFLSLSTWSALGPLSEPLWLLRFSSFFPVCHLSISPIFLPLLLSVVLPSHHPPDCFSYPPCHSLHPLFFPRGLSPSVWILSLSSIHTTALISSFSPVCFCCSGLGTCGVT